MNKLGFLRPTTTKFYPQLQWNVSIIQLMLDNAEIFLTGTVAKNTRRTASILPTCCVLFKPNVMEDRNKI